ncbi:hypothetical protein AQV86_00525 [Nanohaloarchaea archaeon SG9]|nr:hypothetical protein AQV86_00525 [Nanohaloarchaea archaeon SG9]
MELDFKSIRALSSPTRLKILKSILDSDSTTTKLSDELGKSKSTISSHLKDLNEADLVEKDEKEGRRRVVYRPTRKAEAIVKGKERKVKFSVASSVFSAFIGTFLIWKDLTREKASTALQTAKDTVSPEGPEGMEAFTMESAGNATREAVNNTTQNVADTAQAAGIEQFFLFLGLGLLMISASTLIYGLAIKHLGSRAVEQEGREAEVM